VNSLHPKKLEKKKYVFKHVGNPDEKAIRINIPRNYTVDTKSARGARFRKTGYVNQCIGVMLSLATDGTKVSRYVTLSRVTILRLGSFLITLLFMKK
jgi:hypothetical protein